MIVTDHDKCHTFHYQCTHTCTVIIHCNMWTCTPWPVVDALACMYIYMNYMYTFDLLYNIYIIIYSHSITIMLMTVYGRYYRNVHSVYMINDFSFLALCKTDLEFPCCIV